MTIHQVTGVNTDVLLNDAKTLGIDLSKESIYSLGRKCDELSRNNDVAPYPSKKDFTFYYGYKGGEVVAKKVTKAEIDELKRTVANLTTESEVDDAAFKKAMDAFTHRNALIRQVFVWGLYYLTDILDNPKAAKAFSIAWEQGHSSGYAEVANYFDDLADLIK
jgi:hypothetical protein